MGLTGIIRIKRRCQRAKVHSRSLKLIRGRTVWAWCALAGKLPRHCFHKEAPFCRTSGAGQASRIPANVVQCAFRQFLKSQAAYFRLRVQPRDLAGSLNTVVQIQRKPELNVFGPTQRSKRLETQSSFGDVQHPTTFIAHYLNEAKFGRKFPGIRAAVLVHSSEYDLGISGMLFEGWWEELPFRWVEGRIRLTEYNSNLYSTWTRPAWK